MDAFVGIVIIFSKNLFLDVHVVMGLQGTIVEKEVVKNKFAAYEMV